MPLLEPGHPDELHAYVRALEQEVGINEGFLENIFREPDDWSFVIKLNALIEGVLTHFTDGGNRPARSARRLCEH